MKSIIQDKKECYLCGARWELEEHHVFFGTANRKKSDIDGMTVWLCPYHHRFSKDSVHLNKKVATELKKEAQKVYELNHTREEFIKRYGKSYL